MSLGSPNRVTTRPARQRYRCQACQKLFDHLTGTIFAGHHQPLRVWILCLYFTRLNLTNEQIGKELDLDPDDAQTMTTKLREGIVQRKPVEALNGEVECDEVYVVAGHKGHPEAVKKTRMASLTGDVWECTKIHQFLPNLTIFEDLLRSEIGNNVWKSAAVQSSLPS